MTKKAKPKLIVVVGPTASGKSDLAIVLAKKFNGEIISADSRQVYLGLDIGTGKIPGKWVYAKGCSKKSFTYKGIPHHCIDFVPPRKVFSVAEYKKCADTAIAEILKRGKTPILAGGTGFYIDAVIHDFTLPNVMPNIKLRAALDKNSATELFNVLRKLDPRRAKIIDRKNKRRLVRAIEIARAIGHVPKLKRRDKYNALLIGIKMDKKTLSARIRKRLQSRIKQGMLNEAWGLRKTGMAWKRFHQLGLEYRFLAEYMRGKLEKKEMVNKLERAITDYARRQMVWFKKNNEIKWIKTADEAISYTERFIKKT